MKRREFRPIVDRLEERTALSLTATAPNLNAVAPAERNDAYAVQRHQENLARIGAQHDDVVIFGDSMVDYWDTIAGSVWSQKVAPLEAANFGVASDWTRNLIWRLENGELAGHPRVAVVEIGTNDILYSNSVPAIRVANTVAGIASVVATIRIRSPGTRILLMGLFPQGRTPDDPSRMMIQQVNEQVAKLADGVSVRFLDISAAFLQPDGTRPDAPFVYHPTPQEYDVWASAIHCPVQQWLGRPCAPTVRNVRLTHPTRRIDMIVLTFNENLNAGSAANSANYSLVREPLRGSRRNPRRARVVSLNNVVYDPTAWTVTFVFARPLAPGFRYVLTVNGTPPSGVRDEYGIFLDGIDAGVPGKNYVVAIKP